jgi:predicted nucleotidyltransferase
MDESNFKHARSKLSLKDRQQLDRLLTLVRDVLGPDVVGAYLFGSAVLGGLREESDLDVLVVSKRPTTDEEKHRLSTRLLSISGRKTAQGSSRRVELTIVVESDIKPWRFPPRVDFLYGDWLRSEFERGNLKPWRPRANYDLVSLLTMVLLSDTPLIGPAPGTVFGPIPHEHMVRAMVEHIPALLDDLDSDTTNVILTLARVWTTVATGAIRSKGAAADWVLSRLPNQHQPVLARARAIYLGHEPNRWEDLQPNVRPYADYVVAEVGQHTGTLS